MQFVKTENIKKGMRLARPIYNKKGVLLFDRNSLITVQAIESIRNFGLLGIYILEPAEPLPPMSAEDIEFERFQTITISSIQEELTKLLATGSQSRAQIIASMIIKKYGHRDGKINFYQDLRSREDYIYRHSLNVAILCTMMSHVLNIRLDEQEHTVCAALVHDIGKLGDTSESVFGNVEDEDELYRLCEEQLETASLIEGAFPGEGAAIRRICVQAVKKRMSMLDAEETVTSKKMTMGAKILLVANRYDEITAMNLRGTAQSEVKAIQEFMDYPEIYDPAVVDALIKSINILFPGVSIELSTGEKAMVLTENKENILRPVVLSFMDNSILDLSLREYEDIQVIDIMKTLDNRYVMDMDTLRKSGY